MLLKLHRAFASTFRGCQQQICTASETIYVRDWLQVRKMPSAERDYDELEAPLLESAPLPEKRRSTLLTVCPFILGKVPNFACV